ncbi:MAG: hypothetical protein HYY50_03055 [Candidatus Kerfeldbacteria bacterium]|nr:hypothetical protein [Candidatus Kerfeldbacteria bacterium]
MPKRLKLLVTAVVFVAGGFVSAGISFLCRPDYFRQQTALLANGLQQATAALLEWLHNTAVVVVNAVRDFGAPSFLIISGVLFVSGIMMLILVFIPSRGRTRTRDIHPRPERELAAEREAD